MTQAVLWFVLAFTIVNLVHLGGMFTVGMAARVQVLAVSLGSGKVLFRATIGTIEYRVSLLLFGGYVKFLSERTPDTPAHLHTMDSRPLLVRLAIQLAGCAAVLALAMILLGARGGWEQLLSGFGQIVDGTFSPARAVELWRAVFALCAEQPLVIAVGVISAKVVAVNLLPLPFLNGGQAILEIVKALLGLEDRALATVQWVGLLVCLLVWGAWGVAFVRALL